ncbi:hypothetical protein NLI96_g10594 [Meripilus lineatus]|uniref:Membrane-associated proteins in eicosanoid and glutathione metabolism n=1 Tax=Meripilus lineatus TaxID=2056292 RepID=A0AAD5YE68_9APHY|nr:hypothetical protein NLI96_g10594 [Physisporinus lineatus]
MAVTLVLPDGYQYAGAAIISTFWLTFWQMFRVGRSRGKAGIPYPQLYAEKSEQSTSKDALVFNCCQRAHQNTLENLPMILVRYVGLEVTGVYDGQSTTSSTAVTATKYPILAASLCGAWVCFRTLYTLGYSTGNPAKRNLYKSTILGGLTGLSLLSSATFTVAQHILAA